MIRRSDGSSMTLKPWRRADALRDPASGAGAIRSSSPDSRAATRVASDFTGLNSMRVRLCWGLSHQSGFDHEGRAGIGLVGFDLEGARADGVGRCRGGDAGGDIAGLQRAVGLHPFLVEDVDAGEIVEKKRVGAVGDDIDGEVVDLLGLDHGRDVAAGAGAGIEQAA